MRILFDSNVVISALFTHGLCRDLFILTMENHDVFISHSIRKEVEKNLKRKIRLSDARIDENMKLVDAVFQITQETAVLLPAIRDPKDKHVLAAAICSSSDYLVTGDKDLLVLESIKKCRIVTPRKLYEIIKGIKIH